MAGRKIRQAFHVTNLPVKADWTEDDLSYEGMMAPPNLLAIVPNAVKVFSPVRCETGMTCDACPFGKNRKRSKAEP